MILDWLKESLENLFIKRRKKRLRRKEAAKRKSRKPAGRAKRPLRPQRPRPRALKKRTPKARPAKAPARSKKDLPKPAPAVRKPASSTPSRSPAPVRTFSASPRQRRTALKTPTGVRAGSVTHYFGKIQVAVIRAEKGIKTGARIEVRRKGVPVGKDTVRSMQINHIPIDEARAGEEIGLKLLVPAQAGDEIFLL